MIHHTKYKLITYNLYFRWGIERLNHPVIGNFNDNFKQMEKLKSYTISLTILALIA